jgi:hypothetical protein
VKRCGECWGGKLCVFGKIFFPNAVLYVQFGFNQGLRCLSRLNHLYAGLFSRSTLTCAALPAIGSASYCLTRSIFEDQLDVCSATRKDTL